MPLVCRGCGERDLKVVLSLGSMPAANALLTEEALGQREPRYPLDLAFCPACALVQITVLVNPADLFREYAYFSSYSTTVLDHAESLVNRMISERRLGPESLAMEIASNDGYLLQYYVRAGIPVLGIDPAENVVPAARDRGVPTLCAFFGRKVAEELRAQGRRADVIHANNVLAHVPDVNGVVVGIARVLKDGGVAVVETPYVCDLIDKLEFDTIYHEHVFYYSLTSLEAMFRRNGMIVTHVERMPIHGGSLRVFATPTGGGEIPESSVATLLAAEERLGVASIDYYRSFAGRVERLRRDLAAMLGVFKGEGHRIAAYGAAAKGTMLLNALGLGADSIDFVADRSAYKQGRYMPGTRIPVVPPDRILEEMPDEVLLLAWNFAEEILDQQTEYRRRGGRFIIPIPAPEVV